MKIPMLDYINDHVGLDVPTLNASVATRLLTRSPMHAFAAHPRLNPDAVEEPTGAFDIGSAVHSLLIEGVDIIEVCYFADWRTKDARETRDAARDAGKIPMLPVQAAEARRMAGMGIEALDRCADLHGCAPYEPEKTIVYKYEGTWLRCRPDLVNTSVPVVLSYKTAQSAEPEAFARAIHNYGYEMQAAFESNAVEQLTGKRPRYVWVVQESAAPYAVSFVAMTPALEEYAQERFESAVGIWQDCLDRNDWPGYPERIHYVDVPPWASAQWEERKAVREIQEAFSV